MTTDPFAPNSTQRTGRRPGFCRRLHARIEAWYLRRLQASLATRRAKVETMLTEAAAQAQVNARRHRFDPALQQRRVLLRADHQVICDRQLVVANELRALGAAS